MKQYRTMSFNESQCKLVFYQAETQEEAVTAYYEALDGIRKADCMYRGDDEEVYVEFFGYQSMLIDQVKTYGIKEVEVA